MNKDYFFTGDETEDFNSLNSFYEHVENLLKSGCPEVRVTIQNRKITKKQFRALHVWCDLCAERLNDHGVPNIIVKSTSILKKIVNCEFPITIERSDCIFLDWTKDSFKKHVYVPVLEAATGLTSTKDQDTVDPSEVAQIISRAYSERGFTCPPWPSNR